MVPTHLARRHGIVICFFLFMTMHYCYFRLLQSSQLENHKAYDDEIQRMKRSVGKMDRRGPLIRDVLEAGSEKSWSREFVQRKLLFHF